jgi:hypothetical protein
MGVNGNVVGTHVIKIGANRRARGRAVRTCVFA